MNRNVKNKRVFIFGIVLFLCVIAAGIICTVIINSVNSKGDTVNVYFLSVELSSSADYNSGTNYKDIEDMFVSEARTIENGSQLLQENKKDEYINEIKDEILELPKTSNLFSVVPESVTIKSCRFIDTGNGKGKVEIDFSEEYKSLPDSRQLACIAAITKTFTELDFVESVHYYINGEEIIRDNGEKIGDIGSEKVELNPYIEPYKKDSIKVKLYFSDENAMGLCEEERDIEVNEKQSVEMRIVEELINGPNDERLVKDIPEETKINDIKTENGICYVDLSKEFISQHNGGSTGELLTIYAIVNSLTELDYVKQVQFLIDGVKETSLAGHVDFSKTFERDESRINKDY